MCQLTGGSNPSRIYRAGQIELELVPGCRNNYHRRSIFFPIGCFRSGGAYHPANEVTVLPEVSTVQVAIHVESKPEMPVKMTFIPPESTLAEYLPYSSAATADGIR